MIPLVVLLLVACNPQPKVLEGNNEAAQQIFSSEQPSRLGSSSTADTEHRVFVIDTLQGSRYSYLKVKENDQEFWLATLKAEYKLEEEYRFSKGLFKTNYHSTEFNRGFDKIYLVSDLRPAYSSNQQQALDRMFKGQNGSPSAERPQTTAIEGGVSIRDLVQNADDYADKEVILNVKVVKVNANIMDRHWLHLQDGSFDSFDLVATSETVIPVGHIVNIKATLRKDKDFGAGYSYDLILENAELIP